ncbi:short-chain dehydrogenase [Sphingobium sp. SCG-1]|uniref:SDR family oxidoreductase n=1 Tax=Sphingobium sp. SCG-1 TaxID=2072936 RepID=UPI000CD67DFE|nr:SDR family oxidoreductase [Sphingobium sp. SCG-1]AUW56976.1 short-chain dehydrogenase [Sphingobium sp. SCG-1]
MRKLRPLNKQVIVITGASSGIGRATALAAATKGARVVLAARGADALDELARKIQVNGGIAHAVIADVSDHEAVANLAAEALSQFGTIDTWVNNAGVSISGRLEDIPVEDARRLFDVNFWGMVHGSMVALPILKAKGGALINMGSITSDVAGPFMGMYSASKQAIKGFTDALRIELEMEDAPVSVTLIKPGPVATPILEHQRNYLDRKATMPPPFYMPEDVAAAILHAAQHPSRDLFVGGATQLGTMAAHAMPHVSDKVFAAVGPKTFRTRKAAGVEADNLYAPSRHNAVHGDTRGHVPRRSFYTRARTSPGITSLLAVGAVTAGLLLKAALSPIKTGRAGPASPPPDSNATDANATTDSVLEKMEDAQETAAKLREQEGGYQ